MDCGPALDILKSPVSQLVIGVIAVLVPIWGYWHQRHKKTVAYFSRATVLVPLDALPEGIEIRSGGETIHDVWLCEFGIKNSGTVPIAPDDFVTDVEFSFGEDAQVVTAEIISTWPVDLRARIGPAAENEKRSLIKLYPLLLNAGDALSVKSFVTGFREFRVGGRLTGVTGFVEERREWQFHLISYLFGLYPGSLVAASLGVYLIQVRGLAVGWLYVAIPLVLLVTLAIVRRIRAVDDIAKRWKLNKPK